jgi:hypothetical protein
MRISYPDEVTNNEMQITLHPYTFAYNKQVISVLIGCRESLNPTPI